MKYNRLIRAFCHGALKLDISTLFTTFVLWTSLQFILPHILCVRISVYKDIQCFLHFTLRNKMFCREGNTRSSLSNSFKHLTMISMNTKIVSENIIKTYYFLDLVSKQQLIKPMLNCFLHKKSFLYWPLHVVSWYRQDKISRLTKLDSSKSFNLSKEEHWCRINHQRMSHIPL